MTRSRRCLQTKETLKWDVLCDVRAGDLQLSSSNASLMSNHLERRLPFTSAFYGTTRECASPRGPLARRTICNRPLRRTFPSQRFATRHRLTLEQLTLLVTSSVFFPWSTRGSALCSGGFGLLVGGVFRVLVTRLPLLSIFGSSWLNHVFNRTTVFFPAG